MARYPKKSHTLSAEDKALERFTELMIDKIKSIDRDWEKPWFTDGALLWPRNLHGRRYNGGNALMLMLHAEKEGYKLPVWCTFNSIQRDLNPPQKGSEKGEVVRVIKGEMAFPVFLTTFTVIEKESKEKIAWEDYKKLTDEEKTKYNVYPRSHVFNVFNVAQTNLQQVRPELYAKLEKQCVIKQHQQTGEIFSFPPIDAMIANNAWVCPIKPEKQDGAYYSVSKDHIVVPLKEQFIDGESFYGTLLHEMTHSTGAVSRLGRLKACSFGDKDYSREELVAELGSALICQQNGIHKHVKGDSAAYLKSWLAGLEESPDFIRTVMSDVRKATAVINYRMLEVNRQLDNGEAVQPYSSEQEALDMNLVLDEVHCGETSGIGIPHDVEKDVEDSLKNTDMAKKKEGLEPKTPEETKSNVVTAPMESVEEPKKREPQMVTVNGAKITHGHVYQGSDSDKYYFTARLDGQQLKPQLMSKDDIDAYKERKIAVPELMERYYPTKLMKTVPSDAYNFPVAMPQENGNLVIEKFNVYKEKDPAREDVGKYKFYAKVDGIHMSALAERSDLNAYFDKVATPQQFVEKYFGEKLHLKSAYAQYTLPDVVKPEYVSISKTKEGPWAVSVDLGEHGKTSRAKLSFDDAHSYFQTKTASKEQLAAKYLGSEVSKLLSVSSSLQKEVSHKL